jgi:hypothetical protein
MGFVWFSEQTPAVFRNSINQLSSIMETCCVFSEVKIEFLNIIQKRQVTYLSDSFFLDFLVLCILPMYLVLRIVQRVLISDLCKCLKPDVTFYIFSSIPLYFSLADGYNRLWLNKLFIFHIPVRTKSNAMWMFLKWEVSACTGIAVGFCKLVVSLFYLIRIVQRTFNSFHVLHNTSIVLLSESPYLQTGSLYDKK